MDGGLVNPVPADVALQKGANTIIAVCVARKIAHPPDAGTPRLMDAVYSAMNIVHAQATKHFAKQADVVIYPNVSGIALVDFHMGKELMRAGIEACQEHIEEIKQKIVSKIAHPCPK
jgi:NTE family protein